MAPHLLVLVFVERVFEFGRFRGARPEVSIRVNQFVWGVVCQTQLPLERVHVIVVEVREDYWLGVDHEHHDNGFAVYARQEVLCPHATSHARQAM